MLRQKRRTEGFIFSKADRTVATRTRWIGELKHRACGSYCVVSLLWNKRERVEIVDRNLRHPGTRACGDVERHQPPKMRVVAAAAALQPVECIVRTKSASLYQISKTRQTD